MINAPVVLPQNKVWKQLNQGNLFGSIFSSRNISLELPGILSLSNRTRMLINEETLGFSYPLSIVFDGLGLTGNNYYYVITSNKVVYGNQSLSTWGVDATAPSMSLRGDGVMWVDGLHVSTSTGVSKLVGGTWSSGIFTGMSSSMPHPLCVSTGNNFLLVGDGNKLRKRDTAGTVSVAVTLPNNYIIRWIRSNNGIVHIGTSDANGVQGAVFEWDEAATAATDKFGIDSQWAYSGEYLKGVLHIVSDDGQLQRFNGAGFTPVAEFPIFRSLSGNWVSGFTSGTVLQRGMAVVNGRLQIGICSEMDDTESGGQFYENFPAGIWEYDGDATLYHKYGLSAFINDHDYAQGRLETSAVVIGKAYVDPITGGADTTKAVSFLYGAYLNTGSASWRTIGADVFGGLNRGQVTTTRIESTSITNTANKIWCKYRGVDTVDDQIIFKYRVVERPGVPFNPPSSVYYTSSTVFTSTDTVWANAAKGDEVTIFMGTGAGAMPHIADITNVAGTYTITLDEAVPFVVAGQQAEVIVNNWVKIETTITNADTLGYKDIPIPQDTPSTWIQFKVEMRGNGVVIEELQIIESTEQQPTS